MLVLYNMSHFATNPSIPVERVNVFFWKLALPGLFPFLALMVYSIFSIWKFHHLCIPHIHPHLPSQLATFLIRLSLGIASS